MKKSYLKRGVTFSLSELGISTIGGYANCIDFEDVAKIERVKSSCPNARYHKEQRTDIILTVKGDYDFDKHGPRVGGLSDPNRKPPFYCRFGIDTAKLIN